MSAAWSTLAGTGWKLTSGYAAERGVFEVTLLVRTCLLSETGMSMVSARDKGYDPLGYVLRGESPDINLAADALLSAWEAFLAGPHARFVGSTGLAKKSAPERARTRTRPTSPPAAPIVRTRERTRT